MVPSGIATSTVDLFDFLISLSFPVALSSGKYVFAITMDLLSGDHAAPVENSHCGTSRIGLTVSSSTLISSHLAITVASPEFRFEAMVFFIS